MRNTWSLLSASLLLVALSTTASADPPPGACVEGVCVRTVDDDNDDTPDGATLAAGVEVLALGVHYYANRSVFFTEVTVGDEHDGGIVMSTWGDTQHANWTGDRGLRSANASVAVGQIEEGGGFTTFYWTWVTFHDHDRDGLVDEPHVEDGGELVDP